MTMEAASQPGVFCDTSVLLTYVLGDDHSAVKELLFESSTEIIVSPKVSDEFETVPDRKDELYYDFIDLVTSDDESIAEATVESREYLKPNDREFFEELRDEMAAKDDQKAQLRILREKQKLIDRRFGQVEGVLTNTGEQNDDFGLVLKLNGIVDNEDDVQVLCDAARWSHNGGSGLFTTFDRDDILSNADAIVDVLSDHEDRCDELTIDAPGAILSRLDGELTG
jgi:predicted nucleic acid-binding protein